MSTPRAQKQLNNDDEDWLMRHVRFRVRQPGLPAQYAGILPRVLERCGESRYGIKLRQIYIKCYQLQVNLAKHEIYWAARETRQSQTSPNYFSWITLYICYRTCLDIINLDMANRGELVNTMRFPIRR
jgi:hypothetical protein